MDTTIRLILNGTPRELAGLSPTMTLLDALRGPLRLTGTKEGCAEGDCGACTVVIEDRDGVRRPANACLLMLGQLHGRAIRTVEGIGPAIPRLLAETDATQCGFCTPGIVMSAWALAASAARDDAVVHDALAGNLCRCTGYRPIVEAFRALPRDDAAPPGLPEPGSARFGTFHSPTSLAELLALRAADPAATLLAGGTDLGLLASEKRTPPERVIHVGRVPELRVLSVGRDDVLVGAAVPYADLLAVLEGATVVGAEQLHGAPHELAPFARLLRRLGSRQIRSLGTLGGNLGTASPIGDALPPLVALGAVVSLASTRFMRTMPVEEFLTGYRTTALAADEVIVTVLFPRPPRDAVFACEKIAKRHDQDIATVGLSALLPLAGGVVRGARIALGGVAARVLRATGAEAAFEGRTPEDALEDAIRALDAAIVPLSDARGSAGYRRRVTINLLRRVVLERGGAAVRVHA